MFHFYFLAGINNKESMEDNNLIEKTKTLDKSVPFHEAINIILKFIFKKNECMTILISNARHSHQLIVKNAVIPTGVAL